MRSVIDPVIPEDIAPVIKKDGVFQVYTDCPTQYKGEPCIGTVECLDGPAPEFKRTYRCGLCHTEFPYDELSWRPATRAEIEAYIAYKRAWNQIDIQAYRIAANVLQKKMQTRNTVACYGLEILKYAVLLVLYEDNSHHATLTRSSIGDRLQMRKPGGRTVDNRELIGGILLFLQEEELADKNAFGRWQITAMGRSVIEECAAEGSVAD